MSVAKASSGQLQFLERVFPGDSEMARLMRAFDWSQTPLGAVERWPQSLRTSVSILLKSRYPMFLWWGPELIQFYNDGYRPSLGAHKHPQALGQRGRECWAEIWSIIGPQIDGVMERGEETWNEDQLVPFDRNGFLEEIYFTYSYSPIRDESEGVGGTLVVCTETTERVLGERRMRTLRDLAAAGGKSSMIADTCSAMGEVLAESPEDIPFALLYLSELDGQLHLQSAVGVEPGSVLAPKVVSASDETAAVPWPVATAMGGREPIEVSLEGVEGIPARPWPERPRIAWVLPIAKPGHEEAAGVLVAAMSPRLPANRTYRDYLDLVAGQLATGVASADALEEERRRAEALAEIDRAKTDFFSNVSHEFRTPLTLTLGPVEEALAKPEPELGVEGLSLVHRNGLRLLRLVNHLLDFSRIEAGRYSARFEALDLAELTAGVTSSFRSLLETAGLRLVIDCSAIESPTYVDREAWEKIVSNLLSNAFKFTLEGEIGVRLRQNEMAELEVWDTGLGIAAGELPHIFERFHRARPSGARTHEGSGIGLALVKELVEQHGGRIEVESTQGKGSSFTVFLPLGKDHLSADQIADPEAPAATSRSVQAFVEEAKRWLPSARKPVVSKSEEERPTVLIVDDNRDMRDYLERILADRFLTEAVDNGREALDWLERRRPDLVVADIMMPEMDGVELVRRLRAEPKTATLPVIFLSARAGDEAREEGLQAGADDYVVKPFHARELVARIQSQLALARLRSSTASYRQQLESLFEHAPASIALLRGRELVVEAANPICRQLVGRREIVGKPLFEAVPELEEQGFPELYDQVFETRRTYHGYEVPVVIDPPEREARTLYFSFALVPLLGAEGEVESIASFGFEVTDLVHARQRMSELAEAAQVEAQRKDEFLAMLGHELRNPLAPIVNALQILKAAPQATEDERSRRAIEIIDRQSRHLSRLVDDLLDVARIIRGAIRLRRRRISVGDIIGDAVATAQPLFDERRQRLTVEQPDEPLWLEADPTRMAQVIGNLLNNAAKYTPSEGNIRLSVTTVDEQCRIEIEDDGFGIDPELLPRIFDLFTQGEDSLDRGRGGLGVGLTVVRRLAQMHGGEIEVESEGQGRGSRFRLTLPLAPAASDEELGEEEAAQERARRRVLVVDDHRDTAASLAELLTLMGHEAASAVSGEEALREAGSFRPHVVLLDIGLPGMDGYEVAQRLRRELGDGLVLVALTGYGRDSDRARVEEAGFDHHLLKPASIEDLEALLQQPAE